MTEFIKKFFYCCSSEPRDNIKDVDKPLEKTDLKPPEVMRMEDKPISPKGNDSTSYVEDTKKEDWISITDEDVSEASSVHQDIQLP